MFRIASLGTHRTRLAAAVAAGCLGAALTAPAGAAARGWLHWRGPFQNGASPETGLPEEVALGGQNHLWTYDVAGRGTPVIADGRVYAFAYRGEGPDLQELLVCLDEQSGERVWELGFNDYLSDIVYNRYAIGAPTVDAETGNIYLQTTCGRMICASPAGKLLWDISLMERFGRMTFPNGRTGAPSIEGNLVIIHVISSYWGADGPARDRFYAFDKHNGQLVWSSTPGIGPHDSSFSSPVIDWTNGRRTLYAGTGCGNVIALDARSGEPLWRFQMSFGGVNSSVLRWRDRVIAIHGKENVDTSEIGRMVAIKVGAEPAVGDKGPVVLDRSAELWRNPLMMFTSSPILVKDRVYQVTHTGDLVCVSAESGKILWRHKLENGQLHASPLFADGKLYVPMVSGNLWILGLRNDGVDVLDQEQLDGDCLGAPAVWNGRLYVHTKKHLYCFGTGKPGVGMVSGPVSPEYPSGSKVTRLQVVPNDVLLAPGEEARFQAVGLDAKGNPVPAPVKPVYAKFIPPTAKVKTRVNGTLSPDGHLRAGDGVSAGAIRAATPEGAFDVARARVLPRVPYSEDFEEYRLTVDSTSLPGVKFAYPPLPWIGARFKWEIRNAHGSQVLAKTLDRVLFQRAITFIGHPDMANYTMEADVLTDGNRRMRSNVGIINQRYIVALVGNAQVLEVSSNQDRIKVRVPFKWKAGEWYHLKTRVDVAPDGSGVVRAKAWLRGGEEPAAWTIEVPHHKAHRQGSPGLYGFSPQSRYSVYIDNVRVTRN